MTTDSRPSFGQKQCGITSVSGVANAPLDEKGWPSAVDTFTSTSGEKANSPRGASDASRSLATRCGAQVVTAMQVPSGSAPVGTSTDTPKRGACTALTSSPCALAAGGGTAAIGTVVSTAARVATCATCASLGAKSSSRMKHAIPLT